MPVPRRCRDCGLLLLQAADVCPACGSPTLLPIELREGEVPEGDPAERGSGGAPADPDLDSEGDPGGTRPTDWEIVYHCPDEFQALTLQAELERHGIPSWIRSLELPGYQGLIRNQPVWGWLLVDREDLAASGEIIQELLSSFGEEGPPS